MTIKREDALGNTPAPRVKPTHEDTQAPLGLEQVAIHSEDSGMTLTDLQLRVNSSHRKDVYEPNAPEFFATEALYLSVNAGKVSHVMAKITKDGFDKPAADEEMATAILSAAAMSIVHATLIIDEMGYSLEEVMKGVL